MPINYRSYLFNFGYSFSGGGLKRLTEYSNWYNLRGGTTFIIRKECSSLVDTYKNNKYIIIKLSAFEKLFNSASYIKEAIKIVGRPDFYYSYGIPMNFKVGEINWFHLSSVLPMTGAKGFVDFPESLKLNILGYNINRKLDNCDIISAESHYSLSLFDKRYENKFFLSVNGSDVEINNSLKLRQKDYKNIAISVGTYKYKSLEDVYSVFRSLKAKEPNLILKIIGGVSAIPESLKNKDDVVFMGIIPRTEVVNILSSSKYYISATKVENSYNAASEGIFLASESIISDIVPHRELLQGEPYTVCEFPGSKRTYLHVNKKEISSTNLKSWDDVVTDMNTKIEFLVNAGQ